MRTLLLIFCAFLMMGCTQRKNEPKPAAMELQEAGENAIDVLQKLVNEQNYKSLGFLTIGEVQQAELGEPMEVYNMGLEKLRSFRAGQDPNSVLMLSVETIFPVTVGSEVRTGVTISHREQGYEASSFGNADVVRRLAGYRQSPKEFAVRIPALNMYFVGRHVETCILLMPIINDPRLKLQAGETAPLEVVVKQLRPYLTHHSSDSQM